MDNKIARLETALYRIPLPVALSDSTHGDHDPLRAHHGARIRRRRCRGHGLHLHGGCNGAAIHSQIQRDLAPLLHRASGRSHRVPVAADVVAACTTAAAAAARASPSRRWTSRCGT